ncbi:lasso RiPP family leader peptide-containing protein [Streptomyces minutiscleroticus]|nr:lasso RiPP family leader peptide-containing protein [Streptomyces minutiscleroticus]
MDTLKDTDVRPAPGPAGEAEPYEPPRAVEVGDFTVLTRGLGPKGTDVIAGSWFAAG